MKAWNRKMHGFRVAAVFVMIAAVFASMLGMNPQEVRAADTYGTSTVIYRWRKVKNWNDFSNYFPANTNTRMLIVNTDYGNDYFSTGSNFYKINDYYAYGDRYDTRVAELATANLFDSSLDTVYTIGDCQAWSFRRTDWDEGHIMMANGTYLCCHDGSDTCLTNKSSASYTESGGRVWCFYHDDGDDGTRFRIRYNASWPNHDNYMGFHGNTMFCESRSKPGNWHKFTMYAGDPLVFTNLQKVEVAQTGTVTNYEENILIRAGSVLVIPPTAVVTVQGHLWLNGEIRNYGTLILRKGCEMAELNGADTNDKQSCSIYNYGSGVCYEENELKIRDYEAWKRESADDSAKYSGSITTRTQGEGNLIIMEDAILALNSHSMPLQFEKGASLINYGTIISPFGYRFNNATAYNYGIITAGWYYRVMGQDIHATKSAVYTTGGGQCYDTKFSVALYNTQADKIILGRTDMNAADSGVYVNKGTLGYRNLSGDSTIMKTKVENAASKVWR